MAEFIYSVCLFIVDAYYSYVIKLGLFLLRLFDKKKLVDEDNIWVLFALGNMAVVIVVLAVLLV